jgi:hypothetical protein
MYPLLFIGLYYTFIFEFWQLPNSHLTLTLSLPFYIVYPSKNAKVVLYCVKFMMLFLLEFCNILFMLIIEKSANILFDNHSDKSKADKIIILAPHYYNGCMQKRNRHLVDCSSACICFLTKHEGGTACTVDYAKQKGLYLINVVEEIEG